MRGTMLRRLAHLLVLLAATGLLAALPAHRPAALGRAAGDHLMVYADALAAGWANWSWDTSTDLASATAHGGAAGIAVTHTGAWGGLRLHASTGLSAAAYTAVRFWIHGGANGGQAIDFKVITAADGNWERAVRVTPVAGTWTELTVSLASLGSPAILGDLVWQDASGGAQPTFYVDDVTLVADGPVGGVAPISVNESAVVDGFAAAQFSRRDSAGLPRSAALVPNDRRDPTNHWGGYLRQLTYQIGPDTRVVNGSSSAHPGFGYTTNHYGPAGGAAELSYQRQGSYRAVLRGRHHAIHEFRWRLSMGAPVDATVRWMFATGRDHPLWSVTFDASPAGPNVINADTRAPYGDLQWDGGAGAAVAGVGWGDRYAFRSLHSPVTMSSGWDYSQPNTVPYVVAYTVAPDAEMGLVQTETYLQHDAGGYWFYPSWGTVDADGPMPENYNWTYQINQYELPFTTASKRMAWGSNFGAVGQTSYPAYGHDRTLVGYPYQSYAVFVVLGQHSLAPVAGQVAQVERVQQTTLSAQVGAVVTAGPAGVGRPDSMTYQPAGYSPVESTWHVRADAASRASFTLAVAQGTLSHPVIVVHDYAAPGLPAVRIDGVAATADVDYFASLDAEADQLWLTLRGEVGGTRQVSLAPSALVPMAYVPVAAR